MTHKHLLILGLCLFLSFHSYSQYDSSYSTVDTTETDSTYPPEFPGGQMAMFNYIEDQLVFKLPPGEVIGIQGETVALSFRINKKGEVTYYRTVLPIHLADSDL